MIGIKVQLIGVLRLHVGIALIVLHPFDVIGQGSGISHGGISLNKLLLFDLLGIDDLLFVLGFVGIESIDEQVDVLHIVNAQTLADAVNLDGELLLQADALASLEATVVNQVLSLVDQQTEHRLDSVVLLFSIRVLVLAASHIGLLVDVRARLVVLLRLIAVHDRRVLLDHRVTLSGGVGSIVASTVAGALTIAVYNASSAGLFPEPGEEVVTWGSPGHVKLLEVNDLIGMHDFLNEGLGFLLVHLPDLSDPRVV